MSAATATFVLRAWIALPSSHFGTGRGKALPAALGPSASGLGACTFLSRGDRARPRKPKRPFQSPERFARVDDEEIRLFPGFYRSPASKIPSRG